MKVLLIRRGLSESEGGGNMLLLRDTKASGRMVLEEPRVKGLYSNRTRKGLFIVKD